jgi:hypothetical protein
MTDGAFFIPFKTCGAAFTPVMALLVVSSPADKSAYAPCVPPTLVSFLKFGFEVTTLRNPRSLSEELTAVSSTAGV